MIHVGLSFIESPLLPLRHVSAPKLVSGCHITGAVLLSSYSPRTVIIITFHFFNSSYLSNNNETEVVYKTLPTLKTLAIWEVILGCKSRVDVITSSLTLIVTFFLIEMNRIFIERKSQPHHTMS